MAFSPSAALDYLRRAYDGQRLGHAYLLIGGESAFTLAKELTALVVRAPGGGDVLRHPDVHVVEPESKSRRIVVEQMRELENALRLRAANAGGRKVGIVREADRLVTQAANAFLKTLEEPPAESLLLLLTSLPESLPETILSRCIRVVLREDADAATRLPEQGDLARLLGDFAGRFPVTGGGTPADGYLFLREFTQLLVAARGRIQGEADTALKGEQTQYAQTTDGSWLAEREGYYKTMAEARYIAARAQLIEAIARWWGNIARRQCEAVPPLSEANDAKPAVDSTLGQLGIPDVLRRLATLDELRENLDRNILEALALEVAFLQVFGS